MGVHINGLQIVDCRASWGPYPVRIMVSWFNKKPSEEVPKKFTLCKSLKSPILCASKWTRQDLKRRMALVLKSLFQPNSRQKQNPGPINSTKILVVKYCDAILNAYGSHGLFFEPRLSILAKDSWV